MSDSAATAPPSDNEEFTKLIKGYIENEEGIPSLAGLYNHDKKEFIDKSNANAVVQTWNHRFKTTIRSLQLEKQNGEEPDFQSANAENSGTSPTTTNNIESLSATPSTTDKRSLCTTESSKTDSCPLSAENREQYRKNFEGMKNEDKWPLRKNDDGSDIYLEDIMYEFGAECEFEHLVHSFILDPTDSCWKDRLTEEELKRIIDATDPGLPGIGDGVRSIFNHCEKALASVDSEMSERRSDDTIDTIWKAVTELGFFNPRTHFDEDWVQRTILDFLNMYRNDTLKDIIANGSEIDFLARCWVNLDRCYENIAIAARDRACVSTLIRVNNNRAITGLNSIKDKQSSVRPDFLLINNNLDIAVGECGKEDVGGIGKKEIVEKHLHTPKIMKDILVRILAKGCGASSLARAIKVTAINENNTRLQVSVLDSPGGYVCRLLNTNNYEIPTIPHLIPAQLFPIMKLILKTKVRTLATFL
ncbi:hypothetical protein BDA99DRAFT_554707 [Phascolomyces articulosus]|uniref:Uncharacterized protein n=1 Tax=Phascolomyces articulosus TaxID=60185 RepID=A0AAD5PL25_9FUNG|nr:hypothetical protein BDA99DRAFT_554707 [Phascolomyces articulosus]